jgi:hypothetical protein
LKRSAIQKMESYKCAVQEHLAKTTPILAAYFTLSIKDDNMIKARCMLKTAKLQLDSALSIQLQLENQWQDLWRRFETINWPTTLQERSKTGIIAPNYPFISRHFDVYPGIYLVNDAYYTYYTRVLRSVYYIWPDKRNLGRFVDVVEDQLAKLTMAAIKAALMAALPIVLARELATYFFGLP